jgi:hypothetical protein
MARYDEDLPFTSKHQSSLSRQSSFLSLKEDCRLFFCFGTRPLSCSAPLKAPSQCYVAGVDAQSWNRDV